jgi:RNA polymerase sigma factor (sigma-70 family)
VNCRRLIESHLPLVRAIAFRMWQSRPSGAELGDLAAWGTVGLCEAAARFQPRRGTKFVSFAYPRIRGAMLDGALLARGRLHLVPLGEAADLPDPGPAADAALEAKRLACEVRRAVALLPGRGHRLVEAIDLRGDRLDEAGAALGLSKSWASRLRTAALVQMRESLAAQRYA